MDEMRIKMEREREVREQKKWDLDLVERAREEKRREAQEAREEEASKRKAEQDKEAAVNAQWVLVSSWCKSDNPAVRAKAERLSAQLVAEELGE